MPCYVYRCEFGCETERFLTFAEHRIYECTCPVHLVPFRQIICAPLLVKVAQNVCYDSPVTGDPITSWDQRNEDLKRNNCIPYDPEMKTDRVNRLKAQDEALDATIETHVEQAIEKMPSKQRNALASDILDKGMGLEYARGTPHA